CAATCGRLRRIRRRQRPSSTGPRVSGLRRNALLRLLLVVFLVGLVGLLLVLLLGLLLRLLFALLGLLFRLLLALLGLLLALGVVALADRLADLGFRGIDVHVGAVAQTRGEAVVLLHLDVMRRRTKELHRLTEAVAVRHLDVDRWVLAHR